MEIERGRGSKGVKRWREGEGEEEEEGERVNEGVRR